MLVTGTPGTDFQQPFHLFLLFVYDLLSFFVLATLERAIFTILLYVLFLDTLVDVIRLYHTMI